MAKSPSINYELKHYIFEKTGNDEKLGGILWNMCKILDKDVRYSSCLSTSVTLLLALRDAGYSPSLILGTAVLGSVSFDYAWIDMNGAVYDLAIYIDSRYQPVMHPLVSPVMPQIGVGYNDGPVKYYDFQFSDLWEVGYMRQAVGKPVSAYIDSVADFDILSEVCKIRDISGTIDNGRRIYRDAQKIIIVDEGNNDNTFAVQDGNSCASVVKSSKSIEKRIPGLFHRIKIWLNGHNKRGQQV